MLLMPKKNYKNYTDAITWPFIRLINACQCELPVTYNLIAKRCVRHGVIKTINQANRYTVFMASGVSLKKTYCLQIYVQPRELPLM